jgi:hypothetical protein
VIDLAIELEDRPGALADMGEALGGAGVSVEGGGVFAATREGRTVGFAHFLIADRDLAAARSALAAARIRLVAAREVVHLRLKQEVPGQLGAIARRMADAGVNIEVQYSDHERNLILLVDDAARGREVAARWTADAGRT